MKTRRPNSEQPKAGRSPREAVPLKEHLSRRLSAYALAAGAVGVGVLALAPGAEADVIFTPVQIGPIFEIYSLDVNNDGVPDFELKFTESGTFGRQSGAIISVVALGSEGRVLLGPLASGYRVGPGDNFVPGGTLRHWRYARHCYAIPCTVSNQSNGPWAATGPWAGRTVFGDIGLAFTIDGKTHYGWAQVQIQRVQFPRELPLLFLKGYAYETVPNQPIVTALPEPGTLGLLALGSLGLGFWRRTKRPARSQL